ncbi:MAG TPA: SIS domain-containing protein [Stellaceae bacterium]|nr:SIS domain-containing protein [Stellaceae bacterium]
MGKTVALLEALAGDRELVAAIARAAEMIAAALKAGRKILFLGNGGSAADAQHLAAELVGRLALERKALPALALTADTSVLTALGNDYGFDQIFCRQVEAHGQADDVLVAISTSGRSPNVLAALAAARQRGLATIGLAGATGGDMAELCDVCLKMPSRETQKIQEAHIVVGHIICGLVEQAIASPA